MSSQLFFLSLADIFSIYPSIFNEIIGSPVDKLVHVHLPSDADWQEKVYYRLLEVQRRVNDSASGQLEFAEVYRRQQTTSIFDPQHIIPKFLQATSPSAVTVRKCPRKQIVPKPNISELWTLPVVAKAAQLLKEPLEPNIEFQNEHDMRKVYSLIYDVFRYKQVLSQALNDVGFFKLFPQYNKSDIKRIWLMLYDLFVREFKSRNFEYFELENRLYKAAHVQDIADNLWAHRTRLAASISRMRIKYGALRLSQLLPLHLQNEKVAKAAANPIICGWINPFLLTNRKETDKYLQEFGFKLIESNETNEIEILEQENYSWDSICPLVISCIPKNRNDFAKSEFMQKHYFIMQDRQFSYGPAIMAKLMDLFELDGDILQTHISSPRSTAYLAALFHSVNRINNFYVYGAGENLERFRDYMTLLGASNVRIFAESFSSLPMEAKRFNAVVGIFANPPNSFSAVSDPIDLICSRGGDLRMLEVLTETEVSAEGRQRVALILREQLQTLQIAMSGPQIQFILYQTHSVVHTENEDMVQYCIDYINTLSLEKHRAAFLEKKRLEALEEADAANLPAAANVSSPRGRGVEEKQKSLKSGPSKTAITTATMTSTTSTDAVTTTATTGSEVESKVMGVLESEEQVTLPECDEFITAQVPDICIYQDNCFSARSNGCFLSLIRRKDITRLNAKYLIQMAEMRGLFGKNERQTKNSKAQKQTLKTQETISESPKNKVQ